MNTIVSVLAWLMVIGVAVLLIMIVFNLPRKKHCLWIFHDWNSLHEADWVSITRDGPIYRHTCTKCGKQEMKVY